MSVCPALTPQQMEPEEWHENSDFPGHEIESVTPASNPRSVENQGACAALCRDTQQCNVASYNTKSKTCLVKNVPSGTQRVGVRGIRITRIHHDTDSSDTLSCNEWLRRHDRYGHGDIEVDEDKKRVSDHDECIELCKATPGVTWYLHVLCVRRPVANQVHCTQASVFAAKVLPCRSHPCREYISIRQMPARLCSTIVQSLKC